MAIAAAANRERLAMAGVDPSGSGRRNASLDALRALAIVLVVFCHSSISYGLPNRLDFLGLGGVGVDLFFCLSGWLLGRQLCEEFKRSGTIELRRFWLRRWLRTLPAYYVVLLCTFTQAMIQRKPPQAVQYLVFLQNYVGRMPFFGVSWSLCVEEHFYLLVAPLLLLFCRCRKLRIIVPGLVLIPLACRLGAPWVLAHWGWRWDIKMTHLRYDQCAAGVLLAVLTVFAPKLWAWLCRMLVVLIPAGLALAGVNLYWRISRSPHGDFDPLVWSLVFAMLVALANSGEFWRSGLRIPGTRYLADRAYALYLLHVEGIALMTRLAGKSENHPRVPMLVYFAGIWLVALLGAEVLHRATERPFMQARERFRGSRSTHGNVIRM
jgi:peptidoglycan/LPS O-acetylase OafA/YrhL